MKKFVLYYLYGFLVLDMIMGFLLVYLGLQDALIINPGQGVRGLLLVLLFCVLVRDALQKLNWLNGLTLLTIGYFITYILVIAVKTGAAGPAAIELNNVSKYIFMLLLIFYINKHKIFFLERLDTIMGVGFGVLTINLFLGYFGGIGISTYGLNTTATKGLIYSGNAVSILSLVFLAYYFFNIQKNEKAKYLCLLAVFDIYIVGTKAIFIVPVVIMIYLATKINWTVFKAVLSASIILPVFVGGVIIAAPFVSQIFQARYVKMLQATGFQVGSASSDAENVQKAVLKYRRVAFAITQEKHQFSQAGGLLFGYGEVGQRNFWRQRGYGYTFAAMDFIDFLFQYGIAGCLLFCPVIFYAFYRVVRYRHFTPLAVSLVFIFLYSFFGGYVLTETTASTMFGFLIALNVPRQKLSKSAFSVEYIK